MGEQNDSSGAGDPGALRPPGGASTPLEVPQVHAIAAADDDPEVRVKEHHKTALQLLAHGQAAKAFAELVRASREVPMSRRLAAALVHVALKSGSGAAAITLLTTGLDETEGAVRVDVRRQLARLARKLGALERSREELVMVLAERSVDRRARRALNSLLFREERWEELDASLEKETRQELKRGAIRRGARAALSRARLWGERLSNPGHAALWYAQAAGLLEQARDFEGSFTLRLLWLRSLHAAQAPRGQIDEAVKTTIEISERVGQGQRARALVRELGLLPSADPVSAPPAAPSTGRKVTQEILLAAAEDAEARGKKPEAAALFTAAVAEGPDPVSQRRLEAHYVRRGAWRELAQFYRERAQQARSNAEKVELLERMAEVLEDELKDPVEASKVYGEIVQLTGDKAALGEQVRLLSAREDTSGLKRALDQAVERATDDTTRANALCARAEASALRHDRKSAQKDFAEALRLEPNHLLSLAGLAEVSASPEHPEPTQRLKDALAKLPRRQLGRAALLRRLGSVCERTTSDLELASWAWSEVLAELPNDAEALRKTAELARARKDDALLETALRGQLADDSRGPRARKARMELVALLDRAGRGEDALSEVRTAVRFEPGHKEAWLALHERLVQRGDLDEAAWALEQGATSTEDDAERAATWERLATFSREKLSDPERAATYARRAENVRQGLSDARAASDSPRRPGKDATAVGVVLPTSRDDKDKGANTEPSLPAIELPPPPVKPSAKPEPKADPKPEPKVVKGARRAGELPVTKTEVALPAQQSPFVEPEPTEEVVTGKVPAFIGGDDRQVTDEVPASFANPNLTGQLRVPDLPTEEEQRELFEAVRENPLSVSAYRDLADYFDEVGDRARSLLMAEIADALAGRSRAQVETPRMMLTREQRAALRHPSLRSEAGELLSLAGGTLVRLYPAQGHGAGSAEPFTLESGRGAHAAANALLASIRVLGLHAPEVVLSEDMGPPFSLVSVDAPRLLVGRAVVKKAVPEPELRFFAARALFTQSPDLLLLRSLNASELSEVLSVLDEVVRGRSLSPPAKAVREALHPTSLSRLLELHPRVAGRMDLHALGEGARHSANRAGLVACGGVGPALSALKAKRALDSELIELVRFAASERYLTMVMTRLV